MHSTVICSRVAAWEASGVGTTPELRGRRHAARGVRRFRSSESGRARPRRARLATIAETRPRASAPAVAGPVCSPGRAVPVEEVQHAARAECVPDHVELPVGRSGSERVDVHGEDHVEALSPRRETGQLDLMQDSRPRGDRVGVEPADPVDGGRGTVESGDAAAAQSPAHELDGDAGPQPTSSTRSSGASSSARTTAASRSRASALLTAPTRPSAPGDDGPRWPA